MNQKPKTKNSAARPSTAFSACWPLKTTGAPLKSRNLLVPESLPQAMTEP